MITKNRKILKSIPQLNGITGIRVYRKAFKFLSQKNVEFEVRRHKFNAIKVKLV